MRPHRQPHSPGLRGVAFFLAGSLAFAQSRTLPPRDESRRDSALVAFLTELRSTVQKKDTAALLRAISPRIQNSFGGDEGPDEFRRVWDVQQPGSPVWGVLNQLLALGGVWTGEAAYCAPYVAVIFPDDLDPYAHTVVLGSGVRLRADGSAEAPVVGRLNYDIVRILERGPEWTQVGTLGGATGFVATAYLYSPVGFRACFAKSESGVWWIAALVAGE